MKRKCPHCHNPSTISDSDGSDPVCCGHFQRSSDGSRIQRYRCRGCKKTFSEACFDFHYRQRKRYLTKPLFELFSSGVSQRRAALLLHVNRKTVVRKFIQLGAWAQEILGYREDQRGQKRNEFFEEIKPLVACGAVIKSDQSPHYPMAVKTHFPNSRHETFKGKRGCVVGQGELKATSFDPLFSLNHSFAMLRANINRLFRRTWCTTKKPALQKLNSLHQQLKGPVYKVLTLFQTGPIKIL